MAEAAGELARERVEVAAVNLRPLVLCEWATVVRSAVKTGRLTVVEERPLTHSSGPAVMARAVGAAWGALKAPPLRIAGTDTPIPYNRALKNATIPGVEPIVAAVQRLMG